MDTAVNHLGQVIEAKSSGEKATCRCCGEAVVAHVGLIKRPHWQHLSRDGHCDAIYKYRSGSVAEGKWHQTSKMKFAEDITQTEVPITKGNERRIADVQLENGLVIECQHSSLDAREIQKREAFYQRMVWFFDGSGSFEKGNFTFESNESCTWVNPRLSISICEKPVFVDLGYNQTILLNQNTITTSAIPVFQNNNWMNGDEGENKRPVWNFSCTKLDRQELGALINEADEKSKRSNSIEKAFEDIFRFRRNRAQKVELLREINNHLTDEQKTSVYSLIESRVYEDEKIPYSKSRKVRPILDSVLGKILKQYRNTAKSHYGNLYNRILWLRNSI